MTGGPKPASRKRTRTPRMLTSRRTGAGAEPGGGCMTVGGTGRPRYSAARRQPEEAIHPQWRALERESSIRGQESSARSPEEFVASSTLCVARMCSTCVEKSSTPCVKEAWRHAHARTLDGIRSPKTCIASNRGISTGSQSIVHARTWTFTRSATITASLELATSPLAEEPSPSSRLHRACRPPRHATTAEPRRENVTSTALRHDERARTSICERACPCGARDV